MLICYNLLVYVTPNCPPIFQIGGISPKADFNRGHKTCNFLNIGGCMKKTIAVVLIVALFTTGCTGSFNLTRKVYNFHRSQTDKWSDELCFLLVVLIPVYSIATFADAIVFNSI